LVFRSATLNRFQLLLERDHWSWLGNLLFLASSHSSPVIPDTEQLSVMKYLLKHYCHVEEKKKVDKADHDPCTLILFFHSFHKICEDDGEVAN
jgi:hypothetical protein